VIYIVNKADMK